MVEVHVSDQGVGIPETAISKLLRIDQKSVRQEQKTSPAPASD